MNRIFTYLFFAIILVFASCVDKPTYPSQPVIAYKGFIKYGAPAAPDSVELVVSFTDEEGDIGLSQSDTQGIFKSGNLYMIYFFWDTTGGTGHWSAYDTDPATPKIDSLIFAYRVPQVIPDGGKDEPMKGLIFAKIKPFINPYNKIKFEVYLYDKALHKSDTIYTPAITFP